MTLMAAPAMAIEAGPASVPIMVLLQPKPVDDLALLREFVGLEKQSLKPGLSNYTGNDSCQWANDGECDDAGLGTGACRPGTDYSDCWRIAAGIEDNSCEWANDGECDEPHYGTGACSQATDAADCGDLRALRFRDDSCNTAFDNVCNEPGGGDGRCDANTDRSDCIGRERPELIGDHFHGWDDRILLDTDIYPWSAVGMFETSDGSTCTATLIAGNVVVSAAHCVEIEAGVDASGRFIAGTLSANIVGYLLSPQRPNAKIDESITDWVLLRLDRELAPAIEPVGYRALTTEELAAPQSAVLYQGGYSWDTGDHLSGHLGCSIVSLGRGDELFHDCDTTRGDSGSPLMMADDGAYFIIGTDSAFDIEPYQLTGYVATRSDPWVALVEPFSAGDIGTEVTAGSQTK